MAEPPTQGLPQVGAPTQMAPNDASLRRATSKDLSLVSLVPKWSGSETALPIQEFFEILEDSGEIGKWTEADQIQVCALKLTDAARAFYSATPELRDPAMNWQEIKTQFLMRFRDVRSDQYHFSQLQIAHQRKDETTTEFLDRCRLLAQRTMPCTADSLQRAYNEQAELMLLSAFISGLSGTPGRQVHFAMPFSADEALRLAVTVSQAEIQEKRNNAFYLDSEAADISTAGRIREPAARHMGAKPAANNGNLRRKSTQAGQGRPDKRASTSNEQSSDTVQCYECSCNCHYARDCVNRLQQRADRKATGHNGSKTGQGKASEPAPRGR